MPYGFKNLPLGLPMTVASVGTLATLFAGKKFHAGFGVVWAALSLWHGWQHHKKMQADAFLDPTTLLILGLGLVAFIFDTAGGVLFAKLINLFSKKKINPMIGAAGISAFPMSARVVHKLGLEEDSSNFLLTHTIGINVSGQIASVIAGGLILNLIAR